MTNLLIASEGVWADVALLLLRIGLFLIFFVHALPKIRKTAEMAMGMGAPKAIILTLCVAEMVSSVLMLCGFATNIAAIVISIIMLGAIFMKMFKWNTGFKESDKVGWELDFILLLVAVAIFLTGPGVIAFQAYMF